LVSLFAEVGLNQRHRKKKAAERNSGSEADNLIHFSVPIFSVCCFSKIDSVWYSCRIRHPYFVIVQCNIKKNGFNSIVKDWVFVAQFATNADISFSYSG
jgi:hypothetical protein